ncbi:MAG: hypothetical protein VZR33_05600 [Methanosphaera sp.]|nr:hypothetical protein [Methanosphaera sp.]
MEFKGQYLTYEEYKSLGGSLDLPSFNLLEFQARNEIDLRTLNRLVGQDIIPQKVKICVYNLISKLDNYVKSINKINGNNGVSSFNSDGYSESYISPTQIKDIVMSKQAEIDDLVITNLFGVIVNGEHIIYIGI